MCLLNVSVLNCFQRLAKLHGGSDFYCKSLVWRLKLRATESDSSEHFGLVPVYPSFAQLGFAGDARSWRIWGRRGGCGFFQACMDGCGMNDLGRFWFV